MILIYSIGYLFYIIKKYIIRYICSRSIRLGMIIKYYNYHYIIVFHSE